MLPGRRPGANHRASWQHTATDLATSLAAHGWRLERVLTDNGSEFRSQVVGATIHELGPSQSFIRAGRPATHGAVERVQRTILEECAHTR